MIRTRDPRIRNRGEYRLGAATANGAANSYDCDDALRLAVHRAVAVETSRGWRIAKDEASHKIDVVVALAQAALGASTGVHEVSMPLADGLSDHEYEPINWEAARRHGP